MADLGKVLIYCNNYKGWNVNRWFGRTQENFIHTHRSGDVPEILTVVIPKDIEGFVLFVDNQESNDHDLLSE
jgi:hypothetical protein